MVGEDTNHGRGHERSGCVSRIRGNYLICKSAASHLAHRPPQLFFAIAKQLFAGLSEGPLITIPMAAILLQHNFLH